MYGKKSITSTLTVKVKGGKIHLCIHVDKIYRICDFYWTTPELRTFLLNKFRGRQLDDLVIEKISNTVKTYFDEEERI